MNTQVLQGLLVPFLGTTLGAALVFFLKRDLPEKVQKGLSGFAAGVMVAASIWSLLIPALEGAADLGAWSFLPATIGFWLGILFLLLLDRLVPHVHLDGEQEGLRASLPRSMLVALAVALHNLPEGMAVGVVYAGSMQPEQVGSVSFASAFALAVGIALQNVPEGAIVAMPLRQAGMSRKKAFTLGMLSGAVEPLGALLTSVLCTLHTCGVKLPLVEALPLYDLGLSWLLPAAVFGLAAQLLTLLPGVRCAEKPARRASEKH